MDVARALRSLADAIGRRPLSLDAYQHREISDAHDRGVAVERERWQDMLSAGLVAALDDVIERGDRADLLGTAMDLERDASTLRALAETREGGE